MSVPQSELRSILEAAGVDLEAQAEILAKVQAAAIVAPPITDVERAQIVSFIRNRYIDQWPAWPVREAQARAEMPALFAALDARDLAEVALQAALDSV